MIKYYNYNCHSGLKFKKIVITAFLAWLLSGYGFYGIYGLYGQTGQTGQTGQIGDQTVDIDANGAADDQLLISALLEKKWEQLPPLFMDDSHKTLKTYFENARAIIITPSRPNRLNYKAKFDLQAEMGILIFEKKEGKYLDMQVKDQVKPLYFIEKFKIYKANNLRITVGDAQIDFVSGYFYESVPYGSLLVFKGKWNISINPNDEEEKLTLKRLYKKDYFEKAGETGVFMLEKRDFLGTLPSFGETVVPDSEAQIIFDTYRELYGIDIEQFNEYWYLPFTEGTNLVLFEKEKKSYYFYFYNETQTPDTQLMESDTDKILLYYNSYKGLKLSFGSGSNSSGGVSRLNLNIYFNPRDNFISGTTAVTYENPANVRALRLAEGLDVVSNLSSSSKDLEIFRKKDKYYFLGDVPNTLSVYYRGRIRPSVESLELFKSPKDTSREAPGPDTSLFYYLSWTQNFYPNPGEDFFESSVTVSLPTGLNCLASGNPTEQTESTGDTQSFKFTSPGSKGISFVSGNFKLTQKLNSTIPLHFYTFESFRYPRDLDLTELKDAFNFFLRRFGSLDLATVNILLKRGKLEGGVSNNGFVVVLLPYERTLISSPKPITMKKLSTEKKIISPVLIRDRTEDHIIHELAHQWWGGLISWKTYQDVWLTEGLAHFSVLYYLKSKLSPREFNRIIRELKRWVYRYNDSGPIIYGPRINLLENKYEIYQSVIYNKSALVFLMLLDLIGEKEFDRRLQEVIKKYRYQGLSSTQFIREFSGNDKMIQDFFRKWIFSRAIPEVELTLVEDDIEMDKKDFKKVVVRVTQLNTDFVFPLKLRIVTKKGASIEIVMMNAKEQQFVIKRDATIRTIEVAESDYLVEEKKQPASYFPGNEN